MEIDRQDYRILLKHVTGMSDADLICTPDPVLLPRQQSNLEHCLERRKAGEPVSKIMGYREFYGLDFTVTEDVLDPRPDTETLVDAVIQYCQDHKIQQPRILELGVGSGCVSIALLKNIPDAYVCAVDISDEALDIARINAKTHQVDDRAVFLHSDWYESVTGVFDIIVSNPPYIESKTIESLQVEVRGYDPIQALDGGNDGLDAYRIIFAQAEAYLYPHGVVFAEFGMNQEDAIGRLITSNGFAGFQLYRDLSGTNRVCRASL